MRTTLDLNDALLARAKALAARQRTTLTRLIEEGLALRLRSVPRLSRGELAPLPVFDGGTGLVAGIEPASNRSLDEAASLDHDLRRSGLAR